MTDKRTTPDAKSDDPKITPHTKQLKITWEQASIWSKRFLKISSIFGIALTLLYFINYGFSPIDNLSSVGSVAILVASIAGTLAFALLVSWGAPAWIFNLIASEPQARALFTWLNKPKRPNALTSKCPTVISFTRVLTLSMGLFALPWMTILAFLTKEFVGGDLHLWLATASGVVALALLQRLALAHPSPENIDAPHWITIILRILAILAIIFASTTPLFVVTILIKTASLDKQSTLIGDLSFFAIGILWMTLTSAINLFIAFEPLPNRRAPWVFQAAVSTFSLLLLISLLGVHGGLLNKVMDVASIRVPRAQIALSAEGCKALEIYTGQLAAQSAPQRTADGKDGELCLLSSVTVVSRLGDSWRIGCPVIEDKGNTSESTSNRKGIVISAQHVRGWANAAATAKTDPRIERICSGIR